MLLVVVSVGLPDNAVDVAALGDVVVVVVVGVVVVVPAGDPPALGLPLVDDDDDDATVVLVSPTAFLVVWPACVVGLALDFDSAFGFPVVVVPDPLWGSWVDE